MAAGLSDPRDMARRNGQVKAMGACETGLCRRPARLHEDLGRILLIQITSLPLDFLRCVDSTHVHDIGVKLQFK